MIRTGIVSILGKAQGPIGISGGLTRPSARCCMWVGAALHINPDWGMNRSKEALLRRTESAGEGKPRHEPAMCTYSPESQSCPGRKKKRSDQQDKGEILHLSVLVRPHLQCYIQLWGP